MKREQILGSVFKDFTTYGIKHISMDGIAGNLKISKKTLYEQFGNKENLLEEALEYKLEEFDIRLKDMASRQPDVLYSLVFTGGEWFRFLGTIGPVFYQDIQYFLQASALLEKLKERLLIECRKQLMRGVAEGFLKDGQNYGLLSRFFHAHITTVRLGECEKYTPAQTCMMGLIILLKGAATEKGRTSLEKMEKEIDN